MNSAIPIYYLLAKKRFVFGVFVFSFFSLITFVYSVPQVHADDAPFLSGFNYRKSIILSHSSGILTDYPMKVMVGETPLGAIRVTAVATGTAGNNIDFEEWVTGMTMNGSGHLSGGADLTNASGTITVTAKPEAGQKIYFSASGYEEFVDADPSNQQILIDADGDNTKQAQNIADAFNRDFGEIFSATNTLNVVKLTIIATDPAYSGATGNTMAFSTDVITGVSLSGSGFFSGGLNVTNASGIIDVTDTPIDQETFKIDNQTFKFVAATSSPGDIFISSNNKTQAENIVAVIADELDTVTAVKTSNENVDCNGHCLADFDDLRFTKADGTTTLDYWIESVTGTGDDILASAWVEFDSIGTSATTFYMYYGNSEAASVSNGANVFNKFDDFEWGTEGTNIAETSGGSIAWTAGGTGVSTVTIDEDEHFSGTRSVNMYADDKGANLAADVTQNNNIAIRFSSKLEPGNVLLIINRNETNQVYSGFYAGAIYEFSTFTPVGNYSYNEWATYEINHLDWTANTYSLYKNDVLAAENLPMPAADTGSANTIMLSAMSISGTSNSWVDNFIIRKFNTAEPAWGTFGSEETSAVVINIAGILGVTAPATGATPTATTTEADQYTGTVAWSPAHDPFHAATVYTATITLTPKAGYTLTGVSENFFTVAGASTTNAVSSGTVTAVFPATANAVIDAATILGVTVPVTSAIPTTTITATDQYTGTISWSPTDNPFKVFTQYTATITLAPIAGYTLTGVGENFFTVAGASTTNAVSSGTVTAVFPATVPIQLTISTPTLTTTKAYDATTTAAITAGTLSGKVGADDVSATAVANYDTTVVGTGKTITVIYTLSGANAGNYIKPVNYTTSTGVITAKQLTITDPTLTVSKAYDATTTAAVTAGTLSGKVGSEDVSVTAAANYDTATIGTGKTITVVYTLSGANAGNYIKPVNYTTSTGVITAVQLTISTPTLTTTKAYDATTTAAITAGTLSGKVGADDVSATAVANYDTTVVGTGKTITVIYTLSGANAGNYIKPVNYTTSTGVITAKQLTITDPTLTVSKAYDATTTAAVTAGTLSGKVGSEDVSVTAAANYDTATIGTGKTITVVYTLSGANAGNYIKPVNYTTSTGVITAVQLTISTPTLTTTKAYDATTTAAITAGTLSGKVGADDVSATAVANYDTTAVGTGKTITVVYSLSGTDAGNYTKPVNYSTLTGVITAVTITAIAAISGTAQVGVELTAGALTPSGATANYQWQIATTTDGTYEDISGATNSTYTPVSGDETKFIKVKATGTGGYTGIVTSTATGAVAAAATTPPVTSSTGGSAFIPSPPILGSAPVTATIKGLQINFSFVSNNAVQFVISETPNFTSTSWEPYTASTTLTLPKLNSGETKTLYIKFRSADGSESTTQVIILTTDGVKINSYSNPATSITIPKTTSTPAAPPVQKYTFSKYLYYGLHGAEVKLLQIRLQALGFLSKTIKDYGFFGSSTRTAVIKLQKKYKIKPATGYVGPTTRAILNRK